MDHRFEGKIAVITGGAGDIGRATAERFASEGANVALVDLPESPLQEAVAAVERAGGEALAVPADVTVAADVERYVAATVERFGRIDYFFNNAGVIGHIGSLVDTPEETFDQVMQVNVKGVWLGLKYVGLAMRAHGGGVIVNTASVAGLQGVPTLFAYGASKHAVVGMTKSAALTFADDGIRVNAVCPSFVEGSMLDTYVRESSSGAPQNAGRQGSQQATAARRFLKPGEVAALVAFLCSDEANAITGGIYPIDGASRAG